MAALVPSLLLPAPALILPAPPRCHHPRRRCFAPAPLAASSSSSSTSPHSRQPYYRRRGRRLHDASSQTPTPAPRPSSQPQPRPRDANAAAPRARGQEELEAAIYDFMCRSAKPGAFPTREELVAAGRSNLAVAVSSSGGWLSLGWSSSTAAEGPDTMAVPRSLGGVHPDYAPETGVYYRGDLVPGSVEDSEWEEEDDDDNDEEEEASSPGPEAETEENSEIMFKAGIEGMLTRL